MKFKDAFYKINIASDNIYFLFQFIINKKEICNVFLLHLLLNFT